MITPTRSGIPRKTDFERLTDALAYAAEGACGLTFYSGRGEPVAALPYRTLREHARRLTGRLRALPLACGDRVGLIGETSPDFVTAFFACVEAGLVPVPLPLPGAFAGREQYAAQIARQLAGCGAGILLRPDGPPLLGDGGVREMSWAELAAGPAAEFEAPAVEPDDLCYLQYSSGSTRFPRGVAVTHRALLRNCHELARDAVGAEPDDRVVSWLPLYHDMGLVGTLLASVASQASVDLLATENFARRPLVWLQLIARNRGTISYAPCFGYGLCRRRAQAVEGLDLSSWRIAGVGAEMIEPATMAAFADAYAPAGFRREAILASYGLAEATLGVTFAARGAGLLTDTVDRAVLGSHRRAVVTSDADGRSFVRCGRPLPSQGLEIRDAAGKPLPARRVGRVFLRGPSVMKGYFGNAEATAEVIDADGWLDTGDLGYLAEGDLVIVGRAKDTIIVNGRNVWPQDLEWVAEQLPEVRSQDCAAFGVLEPEAGERAVVLIQCRLRSAAKRAALVAAAHRSLLQATGVDCRVVLVPPRSLPRTSSGKLSRSQARERYLAGDVTDDGDWQDQPMAAAR